MRRTLSQGSESRSGNGFESLKLELLQQEVENSCLLCFVARVAAHVFSDACSLRSMQSKGPVCAQYRKTVLGTQRLFVISIPSQVLVLACSSARSDCCRCAG